MKIVLTGSNGFIGSYFYNKYADSYDIIRFSFLKDDISSFDFSGVNTVVHLSALVHQMGYMADEEYERVNVDQTLQLAEKAKKNGAGLFVFMSTVKVYGEESQTPYRENSPCHPEDAYGRSKLKAELMLKELETESFKVSIIRTPVVYGRGVKGNIERLIKLVNKIPVLPLSDAENRRSMVYVGNLCYLINEIIKRSESGIFLASDDRYLSTRELIKLIADAGNKSPVLISVPFFQRALRYFRGNMHKRLYEDLWVDNYDTKQRLSLENPYNIEEGIRCMMDGE